MDIKGNCEESFHTTTYVYEADEQYDYIMILSTTTDVEDDMHGEDESEETNVEETRMMMTRVKMVDLKIIVCALFFLLVIFSRL